MKTKEFKDEFRLTCTDTWGDAVDAWFECAGFLYKRNIKIPVNWQYNPGVGDPTEIDSPFHFHFEKCKDSELKEIGNLLFRYCQFLKHKGMDY